MWVQIIHSKGDLKPVLKCEGVRVGDFESKSSYLMGCSKKRFFLNRMELHFNPDELKQLNFFIPDNGQIELIETEDRVIIRNLGSSASDYPFGNAEVREPKSSSLVPFGGK